MFRDLIPQRSCISKKGVMSASENGKVLWQNPKTQHFMANRTRARIYTFAIDHTPLLTAPDLVIDVIVAAARESLSLAPLQILGEAKWTVADPQLKEIRK
jgi:hypothetical protein